MGLADIARKIPDGPGADLIGSYVIPVIQPHVNDGPHRDYSKAVWEAFNDFANRRGVSDYDISQSRQLASEFLNEVKNSDNSTISSYLSKVSVNAQKMVKALAILGSAAGVAFNAYGAGDATARLAGNLDTYAHALQDGDLAYIDLAAIETAITVQEIGGDYFVTSNALGLLLP